MFIDVYNIKYKLESRIPPHQVKEVLNNLPSRLHFIFNDNECDDLIINKIVNQIIDDTGFDVGNFKFDMIDSHNQIIIKGKELKKYFY